MLQKCKKLQNKEHLNELNSYIDKYKEKQKQYDDASKDVYSEINKMENAIGVARTQRNAIDNMNIKDPKIKKAYEDAFCGKIKYYATQIFYYKYDSETVKTVQNKLRNDQPLTKEENLVKQDLVNLLKDGVGLAYKRDYEGNSITIEHKLSDLKYEMHVNEKELRKYEEAYNNEKANSDITKQMEDKINSLKSQKNVLS